MTVTQQLADDVMVVRETVPSSDVVRVRFGDIDGLRALAVALIVAYQVVRVDGLPAKVAPAFARLAADASQGLSLFLALSAFAIAYPALATMRADGAAYLDVGRYIVKRLLRVYPAFFAITLVAALIPPLATLFNAPGVGHAVPAMNFPTFLRDIGLFGDSTGNDGARAVAIVLRSYVLLPFVLLLWVRVPWAAIVLAVVAGVLDVTTSVGHGLTAGALVPLVLGIAAADLRAQNHSIQRFGLPLALVAGLAAFFLDPRVSALAGATGAPDALRVDPLWSVALFGLIAGIGAARLLERIVGFPPFRLLGAASYAISLVAMPVAAFCIRQVPASLGRPTVAAVAAGASLAVGFGLWHTVDRWFAGDGLRRSAALRAGTFLDRVLANVRLSRVVIGATAKPAAGVVDDRVAVDPAAEFYAPPPRPTPPPADLAILSTRTGSADDLAAEIIETKRRLTERTAAFFAPEPEPEPAAAPEPEPEPAPEPAIVEAADDDESRYEKPGFYRRSATGHRPAPKPVAPSAPVRREPMPDVVVLGLPSVPVVAAVPVVADPVPAEPVATPAATVAPVAVAPVETPEEPPVRPEPEVPRNVDPVPATPVDVDSAPAEAVSEQPELQPASAVRETSASDAIPHEAVALAADVPEAAAPEISRPVAVAEKILASVAPVVPEPPSLDLSSILPPAPPPLEPEPAAEGRKPRAKASLLDRVAKNARRSDEPVVSEVESAPIVDTVAPPVAEAPQAADADSHAPDTGVSELHALVAELERAAEREPVPVAPPAPLEAAPVRSSIRLRIGPERSIVRPDGDRG